MILRSTVLILLFFFNLTNKALCQGRKEYEEAEQLAKDANRLLQAGEVKQADSLIKRSISLYPTAAVYEYAQTLAELPDIAGSNLVMDRARIRILTFKQNRVWIDLPVRGLTEVDKNYAYFGFLLKAYEVNKAFGERRWIEYSLSEAVKIPVRPLYPNSFDYYVAMREVLSVELLCLQKKYYEAVSMIQQASPYSVFASPESKSQSLIPILCEMKDYMNAGNQAMMIGVNPALRNAMNSWLFYIHTLLGNTTKALQHFSQLPKEFVEMNINANYYVLGLIDIQNHQYDSAINKLQVSISKRGKKGNEVYMLVEKWKLYKAVGDAYAGLKFYDKARDNYNIALLAYPGYEPALEGMAKLETNYRSERTIDKTPPVISLMEPSPQRGLKVNSNASVIMIKGLASDPSGLKQVLINGKEVYSRPGGDFWGDVLLKEGMNKITIGATDQAGNIAEQFFEIEKKPGENSETVKEGRNYALLLAAQHYADNKIPSLENPVADAVKLKLILKNDYNFPVENIITLFNPGANDVRRQLLELTNIIKPEDNLVIFYAGHGIWVEKEKKGYWLLSDSKGDDTRTWLPNRDVLDLIANLPARHTLLITDACFSGSVFKTRAFDPNAPVVIQNLNKKISRVAITSGNDTEVPDKSVFMKYLVKALSENKDKYLTAQKMFVSYIIEAVMTETKTEPRYGTLELAGHIGGDFIFTKIN